MYPGKKHASLELPEVSHGRLYVTREVTNQTQTLLVTLTWIFPSANIHGILQLVTCQNKLALSTCRSRLQAPEAGVCEDGEQNKHWHGELTVIGDYINTTA